MHRHDAEGIVSLSEIHRPELGIANAGRVLQLADELSHVGFCCGLPQMDYVDRDALASRSCGGAIWLVRGRSSRRG